MFDLNLLGGYLVLAVVGICVCVGYVIKTSFSFIENKYIPCIMALLGCALNIWIAGYVSPESFVKAEEETLEGEAAEKVADAKPAKKAALKVDKPAAPKAPKATAAKGASKSTTQSKKG